MVKETKENNKTYYICQECDFGYMDYKTAKECENYCEKHKSCSLEITKKSRPNPS